MPQERIILDPVEMIEGRTELDITPWVRVEGIDWGDAEMEAYKAQAEIGESVIDYRLPNRQIAAPMVIKEFGGTTFAKARSYIQAKAARYIQEGGVGKRILSSGGTVYFDIVANGLSLGGDWLQANRNVDINAELRLEAIPDFYEPEVEVASAEEKTATELIKVVPDPGGDMPARVRIVVEEKQGSAQKSLIWSFRSRHYTTATTAKTAYEAEELTALGGASKGALTGASGGSAVSHTALAPNWTPVVGTNINGTAFLTHTGTNRIFVRLRSPNGTAVSGRFVWDVGDLVNPTENAAFTIPGGSAFYLMDAGEVRLNPPPVGSHRWQGQFQFRGTVGGEDIQVDKVWIVNADEGMGVLSAPWIRGDGLVSYTAQSSFSTESGAITGDSLAVGGTWEGSGDADDFQAISSSGRFVARRTAVSDGLARTVVASGSTLTTVAASADISMESVASASTEFVQGLVLRYTDGNNKVLVARLSRTSLIFEIASGGVAVESRTITVPQVADGQFATLAVQILTDGSYVVWYGIKGFRGTEPVLTGSHSSLATGGGLASGKVGIYDSWSSSTAATRNYGEFVAWVPLADAVLYANQKAQLTTDGMQRLDSGGTAYGPISRIVGGLPRLPAGGLEGRSTELVVKQSRGDLSELPDSAIDDLAVKVYASRSWLTVPGTI